MPSESKHQDLSNITSYFLGDKQDLSIITFTKSLQQINICWSQ